ncbi:CC0125/CC1285 family lipoprotein [Chelatococcus asaccharovorans]|uniref:CC0125/CC1285 family lipoprotein n=1 Tax=Chelatococcus asaccharovorans TaxID=28210 RepID=UPI00224C6D55|nr:conserved exported hypothetical protein [Chelatococcus asaccharovorans]CAH1684875.1 conserved exported hypothetical protein [Chelatococcus asaccharovorans]
MRFGTIGALSLVLGLGACATPYQEMGFRGGVTAEQITGDTFRIAARGNGYTSNRTVQDYVLLKAAETAQQHGQTHFAILGLQDASSSYTETRGAVSGSVGSSGFSGYGSSFTDTVIKPGQDTMIRIFTPSPSSPPIPGTFSAADIIRYVGSRVKRD